MMIERKLRQWQRDGLLDEGAVERILRHEAARARPLGVYAVAGLGAFAVGLGIIAIVAANWDAIDPRVKLACDLVLLAALGASVVAAERRGRSGSPPAGRRPQENRWLVDAAILIEYGAVLASIGLVSQVYQLGGTTFKALALWSALTAPLVLHGQGVLLATVWLTGLQATAVAGLVELGDRTGTEGLAFTLVHVVAVGTVAAGASSWLARVRPLFARVFFNIGVVELALSASFGSLGFYDMAELDLARHPDASWGIAVAVLLSLVLARQVSVRAPPHVARLAQATLAYALVLAYAPHFLRDPHDLGVLSALAFIALWGLLGWLGYRARMPRVVNLATALLGLRIVIVYFEVFGTLLDTGIGLVVGGALVLGLTALWVRHKRKMDEALSKTQAPT